MLLNERKPRVLTICGAAGDGEWQRIAERILGPHFRCDIIPHGRHLGRLGLVRLVCSPRWLVLAGLSALGTILFGIFGPSVVASPLPATAGLAALTTFFLWRGQKSAEAYRDQSAATFVETLKKHVGRDRPHLIAHSLGTYLAAESIDRDKRFRFGHIIFAGSIMIRKFPWDRIVDRTNPQFSLVSNEVGGRDLAVMAGSAFGLGSAGLWGFLGGRDLVHELPDPLGACPIGDGKLCQRKIHNIRFDNYSHTKHLKRPNHARFFWRPLLWGYVPRSYFDFIGLCHAFVQSELDGHVWLTRKIEEQIGNTRVIMFPGEGHGFLLTEILSSLINVHVKPGDSVRTRSGKTVARPHYVEALVSRAINSVCHTVNEAVDADLTLNEGAIEDEELFLVQSLLPRIAVMRAAESVLETQ